MSANRWPGISDQAAAQIEAAMARGHKIEAIKIYRQATNCGLKEAKDAIDAGRRNDGASRVANTSRNRSGPNWLTMVLLLIVVGVVLAALLLVLR
ncbi:MAG TPA: ribosomal protein L7/L12 [Verrucomicrobiae bacterium]|nr:ribosomal protein L7/L12 [Verrucomicrobiae bacterium]